MASRKVFVGVEAVLAELDRESDTETCNASFDSVRLAASELREDPGFDAMSEDDGTERWNDCSVEDEVPALPNFLPKRNPGAQLVMDRIYSPLQLFQLFFSSSVVETIVMNTNSFAQKRSEAGKRFHWLPLDAHELYSYMALVVYMGLLGAKNIVDYWSGKEIYRLGDRKIILFLYIRRHIVDSKETF
ncbi:hypothetical protein F2P79_026106 [Pimephales promelas]|nr:hypothetical protein F2P79_026106 [Pimephales promelas]